MHLHIPFLQLTIFVIFRIQAATLHICRNLYTVCFYNIAIESTTAVPDIERAANNLWYNLERNSGCTDITQSAYHGDDKGILHWVSYPTRLRDLAYGRSVVGRYRKPLG